MMDGQKKHQNTICAFNGRGRCQDRPKQWQPRKVKLLTCTWNHFSIFLSYSSL